MSWNFRRCSDISGMYIENDIQASSSGITELYGERTLCTLECESGSGIFPGEFCFPSSDLNPVRFQKF